MFKFQGFTLPMWSWSAASAEVESILDLKKTGANAVIIDFHLSTDSMSGSIVDYRKNDKNLSQLNEAIAIAKSQGLDVWFKPLVLAGYGSDQNSWQELNPTDTAQWFSTYKSKILEIAKVLEENKVSHFILTNELLSLTTNPKNINYWLDIITSVRQIFHGEIGFNCGALLGPWANGNEFLSVPQPIIDSLDFLGLSSYPRVQNSSEFTISSVTAGWFNSAYQQNLVKTLADFISSQKIPVYFTELGSPAYRGGNYSYGNDFNTDLQSQAIFYSATLELLNKYFPTEIQGVFIYNWLQSNYSSWLRNSGTYSPYDWNVNGKPAEDAITKEFLKATPINYSKIYTLPFSQSITGGDSVDVVVFDKNFDQATINNHKNTIDVNYLNTSIKYVLQNIERLEFIDKSLAYDLSGNAGITAKILGAVLGKTTIKNKEYVGIGIDLLDKGVSYEILAGLALGVVKATNNDQIVTTLWTNVVGSAPSIADKAPFIKMLEDGMTPGALAHLAAETSFNTNNINLVGLAQTGIEYTPVV